MDVWRFGERGAPREAKHLLFPYLFYHCYSSKQNVCLSFVSLSSKLIEPNEEFLGTCVYSPLVRCTGDNNLELQLMSEVG